MDRLGKQLTGTADAKNWNNQRMPCWITFANLINVIFQKLQSLSQPLCLTLEPTKCWPTNMFKITKLRPKIRQGFCLMSYASYEIIYSILNVGFMKAGVRSWLLYVGQEDLHFNQNIHKFFFVWKYQLS